MALAIPAFCHTALWLSSSSSDEGKIVLYAIIGFFLGIALFIRGFRLLQRKRLILNTPMSHVRSAAIGLVELTGQAVGPHTLQSPITQRSCFFYRTAMWHEVGSGKNRHWEQVADERFHVPFYLKDPTGMVLVDPNGAEMDIHCDFKGEYNHSMFSDTGVPPRVADFAARNGCSISSNIRVEEYCLKPQNAVYVLGSLATNHGLCCTPNPQPTMRPGSDISTLTGGGRAGLAGTALALMNLNFNISVTRTRPSFTPPGTSPAPPVLTDLDHRMAEARAKREEKEKEEAAQHPGIYPQKQSETQAQRAAAAVAALSVANPAMAAQVATMLGTSLPHAVTQTAGAGLVATTGPLKDSPGVDPSAAAHLEAFPDQNPTVIHKGTNDPTFYISWRSQKEVVKDLGTKSTLLIFGGPLLSAACLAYLLVYFKMM